MCIVALCKSCLGNDPAVSLSKSDNYAGTIDKDAQSVKRDDKIGEF